MRIKIEGDPRTGNTFQEIHIGTVQNYNPNATTIINYNGIGGGEKIENKDKKNKGNNPMEMRDLLPVRAQILTYVSCLNTEELVCPEWVGKKYMDLWDRILSLPEVEAEVYNPGKQHGTSFNRNLVGNIIYYLGNCVVGKGRVYRNYNATYITEKLEADKEHSIRLALGKEPADEVEKSLDKFLENYLL